MTTRRQRCRKINSLSLNAIYRSECCAAFSLSEQPERHEFNTFSPQCIRHSHFRGIQNSGDVEEKAQEFMRTSERVKRVQIRCIDMPHCQHARCSTPNRPIGGLRQHSERRDSMTKTMAPVASTAQGVMNSASHRKHGAGT